MRLLSLHLTVESPLAIRADHAAGGAAGAGYIPGSTLLGSLASLYRLLYDGKEEMEAFAPLFLHEQVLYPSLYPALFDDDGLQDRGTPVLPLPITAFSCKRHTGFLFPQNARHDGHGARDTLFDWVLFKLGDIHPELRQQLQPLEIFKQHSQCHCGEAMDRFEGYYRQNDLHPFQYIASDSLTRLQMHTGIHRASGTVQDGILYSRQVFVEGMQFWGEALFPDDEQLMARFQAFVDEIGTPGSKRTGTGRTHGMGKVSTPGLLRMGTGRTRGMGKVSLAARKPEEKDRFSAFSARLDAFNQALRARAADFGLQNLPYGYFFALTLHSPLLLCDDLLRYQSRIDVPALQQALPPHILSGLTLLHAASTMERVTGWQEIWGTPRMREYAIASGSVFLFACSTPPDAECLRALFTLEEQGMGKRRAEGFGRICISDPFHRLVQQEKA